MDIRIVAALIAVAGTLLGVWLGGRLSRESSMKAVVASNKNAIDLMKRQEFNKAVASFRSAFAPALAILYLRKMHRANLDSPDVDGFLFKAILDHAAAIEEFRIFVPEGKRTAYQKAWEDYRKIAGDKDHGVFVTKFITKVDPYDFIAQKIHDILIFAQVE
jgi:hypothetical protein